MGDDLAHEQQEAIIKCLTEGRKIEAIKIYREATGMGLKESKEVVDEWERKLRAEHPDKMPSAKTGCGALILGVIGLLAIAAGIA